MRPSLLVTWSPPAGASITHPLLHPQERARCTEFRHRTDAARHATGRLLARRAAASWLGLPAAEILVRPDDGPTRGRPRFVLASGPPPRLHLSIAHAGDVVLVAVGEVTCGIDVEVTAALEPLLDASGVFTPGETERLRVMAAADRIPTAARWWTTKEAALKAVGRGLVEPLDALDATGAVVDVTVSGQVSRWHPTPVRVAAGHTATLVTPTGVETRIHLPDGQVLDRGDDSRAW